MNDHDNAIPIDWAQQPEAARLRGVADGELPDHDAVSEDQRARVAFERTLRERVTSVMGTASAPAGLHDRLTAAIAEENNAAEHARRAAQLNAPSETENTAPIRRTSPSFWAGGGRRWVGVAAALVLTATVFVISQQTGSGPESPPLSRIAASVVAEHLSLIHI